jgi:uncharacterized protein YqjF (DUF2071 family)
MSQTNTAVDPILHDVDHRPWPLPESPWVMRQSWQDLLFSHWPVARDRLREVVPTFLEIDTFDDEAWLGITPFRMSDVSPRGIPALPWVSSFHEINVRTYVVYEGIPGVYFFSLDADSSLAVGGASTLFHLPYFRASMKFEKDRNRISFSSRRLTNETAQFESTHSPVGPTFEPSPATLEHWLTERYCLYTMDSSARAYRVEIHHRPWELQSAEAYIEMNTMADAAGIRLPSISPLLHFSSRQDTLVWLPQQLD